MGRSGTGLVEGRQTQCAWGHLTKTQQALLRYIAGETALHGGVCCTKKHLAEITGRNVKTVDRCLADLRRAGAIEVEVRYDELGGQLSNRYRAVLTADG